MLRDIAIFFLLGFAVITGFFMFQINLFANYDTEIDSSYNTTFTNMSDQMNEIYLFSTTVGGDVNNASVADASSDASALTTFGRVTKLMFSTIPASFNVFIHGFMSLLGIDSIWQTFFIAILLIVMTFAVLSFFMRYTT